MTGQVVSVTRQGALVTGAVRVTEASGPTEYVVTVPAVDALGQALTAAQIRQLLVAAWQASRAAALPLPAPSDITGQIGGTVTL